MPNRILRDGILRSQRVDRLSVGAELFYRRLMSVVDDFGRYSADARLLRSDVFPLRTDQITLPDIEGWLRECSDGEEPLVRTYVVRGRRFLELTDFNQRLRASQSRFPERVASQNLDPVVTPSKMTVISQSSGSQETARATTTTTHTSPPSSSTCSPEGGVGETPIQVSEIGIEGWGEFALEAIKVRMSFDPRPDSEVCQRIWRYLPLPDRMAAVEGIRTRALAGVYSDPTYIPSAENYLRKRKWRETMRPRDPPKLTIREQEDAKFKAKLLRGLGVTNAG